MKHMNTQEMNIKYKKMEGKKNLCLKKKLKKKIRGWKTYVMKITKVK